MKSRKLNAESEEQKANKRGFTLIELLVVITIIGITMAFAVPSLISQLPNYRLSSARRQILGDLRLCRQKAITEGNNFSVQFNQPAPNHYRIANLATAQITTKRLPVGITITGAAFGDADTVIFRANGSVVRGGYVGLRNTKGLVDSVFVGMAGMVTTR
ncbi:MAG: prepilin-type N-terminal cleavage/methylation domain-containing protein [Candidatus Edwardsbacteria bacterium]